MMAVMRPLRALRPPQSPRNMRTKAALAAGLLAAACAPAMAQSLTWDLRNPIDNGGSGGPLTLTESGTSVTASAWTHNGSSLFSSFLGHWAPGIGVQFPGDGSHRVDNSGYKDFVLFVFNSPVDLESVRLQDTSDTDVSYWYGNVAPGLDLSGADYSDLASLGFSSRVDDNGSTSARTVSLVPTPGGVNALLLGAKISDSNDSFKIKSISATVVPEPSSMLLGALGVFGLALRRRR